MFHSAALKLTVWYLAIIMTISLVFSISLYHVSSNDLGRNVNRQVGYFDNFLAPDQSASYGHLRQRLLDEDINHLRANLFFFNLLVLACGGAASYWLARRTLQPIEAALDSQTRFASDASHELRTPLTAIQTENEVALRSKTLTKNQAVDLLKSNLEEVAKLKSLSDGLLRLASNNGYLENPKKINLKEISTKAISLYNKSATSKKIKINNNVKQAIVVGDEDSLTELVSIFLDNAIKYSPPGSVISLSSEKQAKFTRLNIADQGKGIKQTELPRIFDRFYQSDSSRTKHGDGGYGLGLAIAKKITQMHGGHIEVKSTLGQGTIFSVVLPRS